MSHDTRAKVKFVLSGHKLREGMARSAKSWGEGGEGRCRGLPGEPPVSSPRKQALLGYKDGKLGRVVQKEKLGTNGFLHLWELPFTGLPPISERGTGCQSLVPQLTLWLSKKPGRLALSYHQSWSQTLGTQTDLPLSVAQGDVHHAQGGTERPCGNRRSVLQAQRAMQCSLPVKVTPSQEQQAGCLLCRLGKSSKSLSIENEPT